MRVPSNFQNVPPHPDPELNAQHDCDAVGPSEVEIHLEHRAALEATLFSASGRCDEVVLELERGLLRLRASNR